MITVSAALAAVLSQRKDVILPIKDERPRLAGAIAPRGVTEVDDADYAVESVFTMKVISQQEIFNVVISLRGRSATGWDDIPT
ncbi:hypothetical protein J6590_022936 [Homalodisca vitripennis]|nr:hypothetical protein J6590_022936 [Homalodisca vitripennis]